jgi:hypothetical protein
MRSAADLDRTTSTAISPNTSGRGASRGLREVLLKPEFAVPRRIDDKDARLALMAFLLPERQFRQQV